MDKLYVIYGDDAYNMTSELLLCSEPEKGLDKNSKILLKPNLVVPKPWQSGATTNPDVAKAVIVYFLEKGFSDLTIAEGSWIGADTPSAFKACGYEELSREYNIPLFDTKHDKFITKGYKGYDFEISKRAYEADLIVNLPVIKGHCQTFLTCSLKNLKGIISDKEKRRFHALGLHTPIAYLNAVIDKVFTVADGIYGDIDYEEGGNPVKMDTMLASKDRVLLDSYAASLLAHNPNDIGYIRLSAKEGVGDFDVSEEKLEFLNMPTTTGEFKHTLKVSRLKKYIEEDSACSACVGNLLRSLHSLENTGILKNFDENIAVGQGFKGKNPPLGIGKCACSDYLCKGCPPTSLEISEYLKKNI